jgi:hypothetical protein
MVAETARILRQPLSELMDMDVDELNRWHRVAKEIDG